MPIRMVELKQKRAVEEEKEVLVEEAHWEMMEQEQEWVERALDETQQTPSLSQAQRIKQESKEGTLTEDTVHKIISEEKKPLYNSVTLCHVTLKKYFPKSYTVKQMENVIIRLLDSWLKKRQQAQER